MMRARFWGVRGSIAAAGPSTAEVGGNTSCVEIRAGEDDPIIVLDAGTGLRALGDSLMAARKPLRIELLLSHFHWDHIQGFPFFAPAYAPGNRIALHAPEGCAAACSDARTAADASAVSDVRGASDAHAGSDVRAAFAGLMRAPHFPVSIDAMQADLSFHAVTAGAELSFGSVTVRTAAARHPNGCLAYRVTHGGRSIVYATDTEHDGDTLDPELLALSRGADVLIYDAQYTAAEYAGKQGWGHSTAEAGAQLAAAAGVGQLILFHHDPGHDDRQVEAIERQTRARFPSTIAAREGLELQLAPLPVRRVA